MKLFQIIFSVGVFLALNAGAEGYFVSIESISFIRNRELHFLFTC